MFGKRGETSVQEIHAAVSYRKAHGGFGAGSLHGQRVQRKSSQSASSKLTDLRMGRVAWGMCTHQSYVNQEFTGNQSINS